VSGLVLLGLRILAAIALYAFLGSTLFILWRSLQQNAFTLASRQVKPLELIICTPNLDEQIRHFTQSNISIGRDPECDCVLAHGTVSAHHARLAFHHSQWWVDDLLSTNGTFLNEEILNSPTVLVNGDIIKCGQVLLTIVLNSEDHPDKGVNK
jgi:hypothetical protein